MTNATGRGQQERAKPTFQKVFIRTKLPANLVRCR